MVRNSQGLDIRACIALFCASSVIVVSGSVTMALTDKDREIAKLTKRASAAESKNREFLSSILSCLNGSGFSAELNSHNHVQVKCEIEFEWMNGTYYTGNKARR